MFALLFKITFFCHMFHLLGSALHISCLSLHNFLLCIFLLYVLKYSVHLIIYRRSEQTLPYFPVHVLILKNHVFTSENAFYAFGEAP